MKSESIRRPSGRLMLTLPLIRREIAGRYRGSALGLVWSLLIPLFMLGIYTFVFGFVFKSRWAGEQQSTSVGEYAVILFSGLIVFQLLAEVVTRAPGLVLANSNYVKKIVFPLEVLVPVSLGSALFHFGVSLVVLFGFMVVMGHPIPLTVLWAPAILVPFCLMILGLSWFLAALGVFVRDIGQVLGTIVTALMFLSPIFFPLSALPVWLQPMVLFNPIAGPVNLMRDALVFGVGPDFETLGSYAVASIGVCGLGYLFFQKTRKGFADVL
jgi:lipopolysaccharide transport system permease protein